MTPIALFLLATALGADPAPAAVTKAPPPPAPTWVEIQADPLGTRLDAPFKATWTAVDSGCELWPFPDGKSAIFVAGAPARYRLVLTSEKGEVTHVAVTAGKPEPPKPPAPAPPDPRPVPVDPFTKKLQVEFDKDTRDGAKKLADLKDLVELYKQAADLAASAEVLTTGQLVARVRDASKALGVEGLADLRRAVSVELAGAMPADEPMTAELRAKAKETFLRIRAALSEVK